MAGPDIKAQIASAVKEAMAKQAKDWDDIEGPLQRISSTISQVTKAQKEFVRFGADFTSRFHAGAEGAEDFSLAIDKVAKSSVEFFGNVNTGIDAMKALGQGMTSFVALSENAQVGLTDLAAKMEYVGFETKALAKAMDDQAMAFGRNQNQLENFAKVMSRISRDLYIEPQKLLENFDYAQQNFAYNAEKTMNVFIRMQKESRKTGVEFSAMAKAFGSEMDTFQGVTQIAGKLNAVLGQSTFNPLELLGLDEADRMKMIRGRLGRSTFVQSAINDPNRKFELKALAGSLNMGVLDFRKLMTEGPEGGLKAGVAARIEGRYGAPGGLEAAGDLSKLSNASSATAHEMEVLEDTIKNLRSASENYMIGLNNALAKPTMASLVALAEQAGVNATMIKQIKDYPDKLLQAIILRQGNIIGREDTTLSTLQFREGAGFEGDINKLKAPRGASGTGELAERTSEELKAALKDALTTLGVDTDDSAVMNAIFPIAASALLKTFAAKTGTGLAGEAMGGIYAGGKVGQVAEWVKETFSVANFPTLPTSTGGVVDKIGDIVEVLDKQFFGDPSPGSHQTPLGRIDGTGSRLNAKELTLNTIKEVLDEDFKRRFRGYLDGWLQSALE